MSVQVAPTARLGHRARTRSSNIAQGGRLQCLTYTPSSARSIPGDLGAIGWASLELRAADPQQRANLNTYLSKIEFQAGKRVTRDRVWGREYLPRVLARQPGVAEAVEVDPSPIFVAKARELGAGLGNLAFEEVFGRALRFAGGEFDVVVFQPAAWRRPERSAGGGVLVILRPSGALVTRRGLRHDQPDLARG